VSSGHRLHEDAGTFLPPKGKVIALDHEFHGIAQRRELLNPQPGTSDEAHLQQPLANLTLGLDPDNLSLISGLEKT
jgi:hypothetical protein